MPRPGVTLNVQCVLVHMNVSNKCPNVTKPLTCNLLTFITIMTLTTELRHDKEVFQVQELPNPRVICKVVHGEGNHSVP